MCLEHKKIETIQQKNPELQSAKDVIEKNLILLTEDQKNNLNMVWKTEECRKVIDIIKKQFADELEWTNIFKRIIGKSNEIKDKIQNLENIHWELDSNEKVTIETINTTSKELLTLLWASWDDLNVIYDDNTLSQDQLQIIINTVYKQQLPKLMEYIKDNKESELKDVMNNNTIDPSERLNQWNKIEEEKKKLLSEIEQTLNTL
jgi:hypothetical protein